MTPPRASNVRVAHVSSAHRWTDNRIHLREAASLSRAGYDVHLIAVEHDVAIEATGVTDHQLTALPRVRRLTLGSMRAIIRALQTRPRVVHMHDPELIWAVVPLRLMGKVVIYDAHEDLPLQVMLKDYLPRSVRAMVAIFARILLRVAAHSTHVVAATEAIARRFPADRVTVVRNLPVLRPEESSWETVSARPPNIAYNGALTTERGARVLVEALGHPDFPEGWGAILAGDVAPVSLLGDLQALPGWARVDYRGVVSPHAARDLLRECRLGVVLSQKNQSYLESLPTKMFEFFAAGVPVIVSDFPLWQAIVADRKCGLLVDETSPGAVARAVATYASDAARLEADARNARSAAVDEYNWRSEEEALVALYDRLLH